MNLKKYRKILNSKITERNYIKKELKALESASKALDKKILAKDKAYLFIEEVSIQTQRQLEFNINDMVGAGLNAVFDQQYAFDTHFEIKRGRPECAMSFNKKGHLVDPLEFSGLGAADVAAFSLRGSSLSMANRFRRVLLLDEPFQRLKGKEENKRVIALMQSISQKLKIQIIMVSDERAAREDIVNGADRVFHVTQNFKGISKIEVIK